MAEKKIIHGNVSSNLFCFVVTRKVAKEMLHYTHAPAN